MANVAPAIINLQPSITLPGAVMMNVQTSQYPEVLADRGPKVMLGEGDLAAYINRVEYRTKVASGNVAYNELPSCEIILSQLEAPTYLVRVRGEWDHHDTAAFGRRGIDLAQAQRLAMRAGIFNQMRNAGLYGFNPQNGEGLLNSGGVAVTLPADQYGNTTFVTYDNGQMAQFILGQVVATKQRMFQFGRSTRVVVLGPQRVLGAMALQNIVQVTQYQRPGGGTGTTASIIRDLMESNGDSIQWCYDDTLIGKGQNGSDAILIVVPEIETPSDYGVGVNTNEFAKVSNGFNATTMQLCDMVAPREIPTPLAGGAVDVLAELRVTSGWGVRPEAITVVSMVYQ